MKQRNMLLLGLASILLVTGCGNNESEKRLVCTSKENTNGLDIEQIISMTFQNDKLNHMKMDINTKITDEEVKENWSEFVKAMDGQNEEVEKNGMSLKVEKDDKNYEYKVILDVDLEKVSKEDLESYDLNDLADDSGSLEENKKTAESEGYTCTVE